MNHTFAMDVQDAVFVQIYCPEKIKRTVEQLICMFRDGRPDAEDKTDYSDQWLGSRLFGNDAISKSSEALRAKGRAAREEICEWQTNNKITFATFYMGGMERGEKIHSKIYLPVLDLIISVKDALGHRRFGKDRMRTEILKTVKNNLHLITDKTVRIDLVARRNAAFEVKNTRKANAPLVATQKYVSNMLAQNLDPRAAIDAVMDGEKPSDFTVPTPQNQQVTDEKRQTTPSNSTPALAPQTSEKGEMMLQFKGEILVDVGTTDATATDSSEILEVFLDSPDKNSFLAAIDALQLRKFHHNMNNEYMVEKAVTESNGESSNGDTLNSLPEPSANNTVEPPSAPVEVPPLQLYKDPDLPILEELRRAEPKFPLSSGLVDAPLSAEAIAFIAEDAEILPADGDLADPVSYGIRLSEWLQPDDDWLTDVVKTAEMTPPMSSHANQHDIYTVQPHCPDCQWHRFLERSDWLKWCRIWLPMHSESDLDSVWATAFNWRWNEGMHAPAGISLALLKRAKKELGIKPVPSPSLDIASGR